jgi:hypothetical protein
MVDEQFELSNRASFIPDYAAVQSQVYFQTGPRIFQKT